MYGRSCSYCCCWCGFDEKVTHIEPSLEYSQFDQNASRVYIYLVSTIGKCPVDVMSYLLFHIFNLIILWLVFKVYFCIRYKTGRSDTGSGLSGMALLVVTLKLLVEPNQLMLVFINIFVGMQQAFFGADFTAVSFVIWPCCSFIWVRSDWCQIFCRNLIIFHFFLNIFSNCCIRQYLQWKYNLPKAH